MKGVIEQTARLHALWKAITRQMKELLSLHKDGDGFYITDFDQQVAAALALLTNNPLEFHNKTKTAADILAYLQAHKAKVAAKDQDLANLYLVDFLDAAASNLETSNTKYATLENPWDIIYRLLWCGFYYE